jgi:ABC-type multidrug transport system fused ATPase/permease subunit
VPQDVVLANGTVRTNVALGLPDEAIDDDLVWEALRRAHLEDYLRGQREGLDTVIGENGVRLSGGQRQRLGIARALYTRPRLLVLDEATSALDNDSQSLISASIENMRITRISIAHRLSTIRNADNIFVLREGSIISNGKWSEVSPYLVTQ